MTGIESFENFMHEAESFRDAFVSGMNEIDEKLVERIKEHGRRAEHEIAVMMGEKE